MVLARNMLLRYLTLDLGEGESVQNQVDEKLFVPEDNDHLLEDVGDGDGGEHQQKYNVGL